MYSREQLIHMKKKILLRIADYFNITGISRLKKEELVDRIISVTSPKKLEDEDVQMSVRIRRINKPEDDNE